MTNEYELEVSDDPRNISAELRESRWSVISFDKLEAQNLNYPEAELKLAELLAQNISGLCIITDEAAARMNTGK